MLTIKQLSNILNEMVNAGHGDCPVFVCEDGQPDKQIVTWHIDNDGQMIVGVKLAESDN